jgi:hypothetical protein
VGLTISLPASIGDFDLDDDSREMLGRHLLLNEIRKVRKLIDAIGDRESRGELNDKAANGSVALLCQNLSHWLREELAATIRKIDLRSTAE